MMKERVRVGLAGVGHIGREYLDYLMALPTTVVTAVCDTDEDVRRWAAERAQAYGFSDYRDMLNGDLIDVFVICTPHDTHTAMSLDAMHRGIHVFKEKPLATTAKDAIALVEAGRQRGLKVGVSAQRRFHLTYKTGGPMIERLGKVFLIRAEFIFDGKPRDFGWRGQRLTAGGGAILDAGYHMIDLACFYFGMPNEVFAYSTSVARPEVTYDTEDTALISFRYPNGVMGSIIISRASAPPGEYLAIHGSEGTLTVSRTGLRLFNGNGVLVEQIRTARCWKKAFNLQFQDYLSCLDSEREPVSSACSHLPTVAFIEAAYASQVSHLPSKPEVARNSGRGSWF